MFFSDFFPLSYNDQSNSTLTDKIANLSMNSVNRDIAANQGLTINNVTWEDTARYKYSCFGPNICDLTLFADGRNMPVLRKPNFSDITADIPINSFSVTCGNEKSNGYLTRMLFSDYIKNILKKPSLILPRDNVLLASAQACILPLNNTGEVSFVPQIYSYQASSDDPAVLLLIASNQGTSAHLLTGSQQKLYFNRGGKATKFLAKRLQQDRQEQGISTSGPITQSESDRNIIFLIQIPLKQRNRHISNYSTLLSPTNNSFGDQIAMPQIAASTNCAYQSKGMDHAMLRSSDKIEGTFDDISEKNVERDERYPIRVTLQFYRVTDNPNLELNDVNSISQAINRVYSTGIQQGSLVTSNHIIRQTESDPSALRDLQFLNDNKRPMFAGM